MNRLQEKVAFITGAARGQGRSDAVRLAEEGADIIAVDLCDSVASLPYPPATRDDLEETARLVRERGRRVVARVADVRDETALRAALDTGIEQLGRLDTVVASAGILTFGPAWEISAEAWADMLDVNLTGAWITAKVCIPKLLDAKQGGSIIIHSSKEGLKGLAGMTGYTASKHGVTGLMLGLSLELAPHFICVNTINATVVDTPMVHNDATYAAFLHGVADPTRDDAAAAFAPINAMPIGWVDPRDVSDAVVFLASDESRYITGVALPVDAGALYK